MVVRMTMVSLISHFELFTRVVKMCENVKIINIIVIIIAIMIFVIGRRTNLMMRNKQ